MTPAEATSAERSIAGLHHVTAITADPQRNIDFYCGVLGLRLVKLTVNFDDPGSYHLYFGDELGTPGTILTFFAWPGARRGRPGPPQVTVTAFSAPRTAHDHWFARLHTAGAAPRPAADRFGDSVLAFTDPDGLRLEIIGSDDPPGHPWAAGPIPAPQALRGFHSVTLAEEGYEDTARLLQDLMHFTPAGTHQDRFRFRATTGPAALVDLLCVPAAPQGTLGAGVVHHVAFRTPDDPQQAAWREQIVHRGLNVSPIMDRRYFHSIYYREPGGILFEIATDTPGFTADEPAADLGTRLMLPPWFEPRRAEIERSLPPLRMPVRRD
jgi:glyoxalase family protein